MLGIIVVVYCSLDSTDIKIIDFGSACHEEQTVYTYIQSRFYRSPEVLLGLPYSAAVDMWSLGCIVAELYLGLPLFPGSSEYDQIFRIISFLGMPPTHMIEFGKNSPGFFYKASGTWKLKDLENYNREKKLNEQPSKLYFLLNNLRDIILNKNKNDRANITEEIFNMRESLLDFLLGLLNMNPMERWSPQQAKLHPFVTGEKYSSSFQPPMMLMSRKQPPLRTRPRANTINSKFGVPPELQRLIHSSVKTTNPPPSGRVFERKFSDSFASLSNFDSNHTLRKSASGTMDHNQRLRSMASGMTGSGVGPGAIPGHVELPYERAGMSRSHYLDLIFEESNSSNTTNNTAFPGQEAYNARFKKSNLDRNLFDNSVSNYRLHRRMSAPGLNSLEFERSGKDNMFSFSRSKNSSSTHGLFPHREVYHNSLTNNFSNNIAFKNNTFTNNYQGNPIPYRKKYNEIQENQNVNTREPLLKNAPVVRSYSNETNAKRRESFNLGRLGNSDRRFSFSVDSTSFEKSPEKNNGDDKSVDK